MIAELTIDRRALRSNVVALRALATPARYWAVVKANAYGHGLVETARSLADLVAGFCVYRADEAATIRAAGIRAPLLVLGPIEAGERRLVLESGAIAAVWDVAFGRALGRAARSRDRACSVHMKIDTGVTRLGFGTDAAAEAITSLCEEPGLAVSGAFTHLAAAEELQSDFTRAQLAGFEAALAPVAHLLSARGAVRHAAASAAAILYPSLRLDLFRAGIATYGIWPSAQTRAAAHQTLTLTPALTWSTKLVVVRDVAAGRTVGYGCTFTTSRPSRIGVLPIGYAEGLPRALSGTGAVLVEGHRAPFVGRICMNMSFIDITDVPTAATGSTVTLVGRNGTQTQAANALAAAAGTIGYELVARLPADIPRRYIDGEPPAQTLIR